jgi:hypothetical protein
LRSEQRHISYPRADVEDSLSGTQAGLSK